MTDPKNQEPSMEEILASIRRIIAEDSESAPAPEPEVELPDIPAALTPEPPPPPPPPPPLPTPPPPPPMMMAPELEEDILELTEIVEDEAPAMPPPPEPEPFSWPEPEPEPMIPPRRDFGRDRLVSEETASTSGVSFANVLRNAERNRRSSDVYLSDTAITLEEIVKDLLRPMLSNWLDEHLAGIVERLVREEIQRISRDAM